jgi:DNA-binding MarR family transcriptional regulator
MDAEPGDLVLLLVRAAKALVDDVRARRGPSEGPELTVVQGLAAHYVAEHEDVTTADLARDLKITKQSAAELVGALEAAGVVARVPHPRDRRARIVRLTRSGRARLAAGRQRWIDVEQELVALVGRARIETVRGVLQAYLAEADVAPSTAGA